MSGGKSDLLKEAINLTPLEKLITQSEADARVAAALEDVAEHLPVAPKLAMAFHAHYEYLAPQFGYQTREESAKPWDEVPDNNKQLMIAVCDQIRGQLFNYCCSRTPAGAAKALADREAALLSKRDLEWEMACAAAFGAFSHDFTEGTIEQAVIKYHKASEDMNKLEADNAALREQLLLERYRVAALEQSQPGDK